ncbi:MAG: phosphotransferase enzyme family protein [Bacteroidota bacterium]
MESIIQQFLQFDRLVNVSPVGDGNINDTWRITVENQATEQSYILQRINHRIFRDPAAVMQNIQRVTAHIAGSDFPYSSPAPVRALNGNLLCENGEGFWRVFPFLDNTYVPDSQISEDIAYEAARAYGAFARALGNFPAQELSETIPGFHNTDRRWDAFLEVIEKDPAGRVHGCTTEIEAMYSAKPLFDRISRLKLSGALPIRVTHNDTKAGNILFSKETDKAVAVIDLDTVMPGVILSDFGDMVRTFVPDRREDAPGEVSTRPEMLQALLEGFLSSTSGFLNDTEQELLVTGGAWITGEQALRFLTDWLAGDVYYKIAHPEHNLVRSRNQILLFNALMNLNQL